MHANSIKIVSKGICQMALLFFFVTYPAYKTAAENESFINSEIAKKISIIKELSKSSSPIDKLHLKRYVTDESPALRWIAISEIVKIENGITIDELRQIEKSEKDWFVKDFAGYHVLKRELESISKKDKTALIIENLKNNRRLAPYIGEDILENNTDYDVVEIEKEIPSFKYVLSSLNNRIEVKKRLGKLNSQGKIRKALELLITFDSVEELEEAIKTLINAKSREVIADILRLLESSKNIPTTNPPPWTKNHTSYRAILIALKSIPDERSISSLEELSKSEVRYVAQEAQDALKWIELGVPYPYEYERIFIMSTDDIPPN